MKPENVSKSADTANTDNPYTVALYCFTIQFSLQWAYTEVHITIALILKFSLQYFYLTHSTWCCTATLNFSPHILKSPKLEIIKD